MMAEKQMKSEASNNSHVKANNPFTPDRQKFQSLPKRCEKSGKLQMCRPVRLLRWKDTERKPQQASQAV